MRKHYESLNYLDGQPGMENFTFTRTKGSSDGYLTVAFSLDNSGRDVGATDLAMGVDDVTALRDMLNEVLEDWK